MVDTSKPWWVFPRIDNFGTIDPQGNFWKPDSNIQLPGNYPILALLPGTVTSVQKNTGFGGQTVVTIKLDSPLNSLATHSFYEHMSSATVTQGQHVNFGDLIGYNNPSGAVPLGFGFYSGDVYGSGSAWQTLQNDLRPGGQGLLNPTKTLDNAKKGKPTAGCNCPFLYFDGGDGQCHSYIPGLPNLPCGSTSSPVQQAPAGAIQIIPGLQPIGDFFTHVGALINDPVRLGKGFLGIVLILAGVVLLVKQLVPPQVAQAVKLAAVA